MISPVFSGFFFWATGPFFPGPLNHACSNHYSHVPTSVFFFLTQTPGKPATARKEQVREIRKKEEGEEI
jgi:hypothetical protein